MFELLVYLYADNVLMYCAISYHICDTGLQNDHKSLMSEIEEGLHELHGLERQQREQGIPPPKNGAKNPVEHIPFAKVDQVSEGSPADNAVSIYYG